MDTTTKPLDVAEVRALLVRAVEEKGPDYVYVDPRGNIGADADCVNFAPDGSPSCIAGHVYAYMGLDEATTGQGTVVFTVAKNNPDLFTIMARQALQEAQNAQDTGSSWGEALAAFDKVAQS